MTSFSWQSAQQIMKKYWINMILVAGIVGVAALFMTLPMNKNALKTDLLSESAIEGQGVQLEIGKISSKSLDLIWSEATYSSDGNRFFSGEIGFFSGEVKGTSSSSIVYDIRQTPGEVKSNEEVQSIWKEKFVPISYENGGIEKTSQGKNKVTVNSLTPDTIYTFAVLRYDETTQVSSFSKPISVRTQKLSGTTATEKPKTEASTDERKNKNANQQIFSENENVKIHNINTNSTLEIEENEEQKNNNSSGSSYKFSSWDSYRITLYIYYKNWNTLIASLNSQGIPLPKNMTEKDFLSTMDVNSDCKVSFEDASLITEHVNKRTALEKRESGSCE